MTYIELQQAITDTYSQFVEINEVYDHSSKLNQKDTKYPCVVFELSTINDNGNFSTFTFDILVANKMQINQSTVHHNQSIEILKKGFKILEDEYDVEILYPIQYQLNSLKFSDVLDIVMVTISMRVENTEDCK